MGESPPDGADPPYFYVYTTDHGHLYYFNTVTQTCTYRKPAHGYFIDPDTIQPYVFAASVAEAPETPVADDHPPVVLRRRLTRVGSDRFQSLNAPVRLAPQASTFTLPIAMEAPNPQLPVQARVSRPEVFRRRGTHYGGSGSFSMHSLPKDDSGERPPLPSVPDLAEEVLQRPPPDSEVPLRVLPPGQAFQANPITMPVLPTPGKAFTKLALESFRQILAFTKVPASKKAEIAAVLKMLKACAANPNLADEVFFQLAKQTQKNEVQPYRARTWELFVIVATAVPASQAAVHNIATHLARHAGAGDPSVAGLARFALIRFEARSEIGRPVEPLTNEFVETVPREIGRRFGVFETSIYEQLFAQREAYPRLPIPILVYTFTKVLIEKGALSWEGVFRRSGELTVVQNTVKALNQGQDAVTVLNSPGCRVNELSQMFKQWFSTLPQRIVSAANVEMLYEISNTSKDYIAFVESQLPRAHRHTLKFMCGFLQQIAKEEEATRMNIRNIGIVFAPVVLSPPPPGQMDEIAMHTRLSHEFMGRLLESWDTQDIYPLPAELLGS
jgi:hypothetical protein